MSDLSSSPSTFDITRRCARVEKPWGCEIHWTPTDRPYVGKVLHIDAGKRLSLPGARREARVVVPDAGRAKVVWDDGTGELVETELEPGLGYSCAIGQRHRLVGITDCDVLEVSTPEIGTTFRLEDDYARPDETEALRESPGRGWAVS